MGRPAVAECGFPAGWKVRRQSRARLGPGVMGAQKPQFYQRVRPTDRRPPETAIG